MSRKTIQVVAPLLSVEKRRFYMRHFGFFRLIFWAAPGLCQFAGRDMQWIYTRVSLTIVRNNNNTPTMGDPLHAGVGPSSQPCHSLMRVAWHTVVSSTLWAVFSGPFGKARSQPEPCTGYCWSTYLRAARHVRQDTTPPWSTDYGGNIFS